MDDGSYSIDGFTFGRGTDIDVSQTAVDMGTMTTQDAQVIGTDGRAFGRDFLAGTSVTFTGQVRVQGDPYDPATAAQALRRYGEFAAAWVNPESRMRPGVVQQLRLRYPGAPGPVTAYGRGRQIAPTTGLVHFGIVSYVAQFDMADANFYSDEEYSISFGLTPAVGGGVIPPVIPPHILASVETQDNTVVNPGSATWPVIEITGPITNPIIEYPTRSIRLTLQADIPAGLTVTIDTRPWVRSISYTDSGSSLNGLAVGNRLADLMLPTGATVVGFTGQDLTGSARCRFTWRTASYFLAAA